MLEGFTPFPDDFAAQYRAHGCWHDKPLGWYVTSWAKTFSDRIALVAGGRQFSYRDLSSHSTLLAHHFLEIGIRPRDRVVIQLPNTPEFIIVLFALLKADVLPVLALPAHREHEIAQIMAHAEAVAYVFPSKDPAFDFLDLARRLRERLPHLRYLVTPQASTNENDILSLAHWLGRNQAFHNPLPDPDPGDVALFLLSGGTTGVPKLIPRTHNDYAYNFRQSAEVCLFSERTVYLASLPAAHNFPLACPGILGTFHVGGRVVLADRPDPATVFPLIAQEKVTDTALVPALAIRWADSPLTASYPLSSLRLIQVGGSRMPAELAKRVRTRLGCQLQQVFGMAEGLVNYTRLDDPENVIENTQGRPMSFLDEIRVVDSFDRPVPKGHMGHLLTRGPYTIRGYYRAESANADSFTLDGFYRTGDLVHLDASGNLIVDGRAKDLINRGGEKISAEEVENVLLSHPAVAEAAVVAMPDPVLGERTCAYVILRPGSRLTLSVLGRHMDHWGLAKYKWPERLEIVSSFPLTSVGKVNKKALREDIQNKIADETKRTW